MRQISFNEFNYSDGINNSVFVVVFMWVKRGVVYEEGCGTAGSRF